MNIEVFSSLQNSEFDIRYSIFSYMILCLYGRDESRPYRNGQPTRFLYQLYSPHLLHLARPQTRTNMGDPVVHYFEPRPQDLNICS